MDINTLSASRKAALSLIEDVTDWETADTLVPTYFFSGELKEGTYQIALTLTENTGYTTVFEKEYTVQVVASGAGGAGEPGCRH